MIEAVWTTALTAILERHVEAASVGDIGLWTLRGLSVLDPVLTADRQEAGLRLLANGQVLATRPLPPPGLPPAATAARLAEALAALDQAGWNASLPLRRAGSDRMLASGFDELFNHMDPYSRYWPADEAQRARDRRVGQAGLGLRLAAGRGNQVVLTALAVGGPAAEAGLRDGDRVLSIDGVAVSTRDLGAAAALLEGPAGTSTELTVMRAGRRRSVLLVRRPVPPETVRVEWRDGVLWLRVAAFSAASGEQVANALREAFGRATPPIGVVLDLRGNRGGVLTQAVAMADAFLDGGVVARTAGRHPEAVRAWPSDRIDLADGKPVVVLVDGRSASAAEVVAAALGDRGRAAIVGSTTMGKGLIQLLVPLPNGAEMSLSWSRILAPSGWPIQGIGVIPGLCTSLGEEVQATQLATLATGVAPMAAVLARQRQARDPVPATQAQALRAACPPAEGRAGDVGAATALIANPDAFRAATRR
ncbi:S41 family peptidase [Humitalea sp. 24SJ18S-53]|uniref:S41 family peptidase n=1 Tax=Humitalea sp. 24SJ18S-53 TaxID=3422307 RepID=UPI003D67D149